MSKKKRPNKKPSPQNARPVPPPPPPVTHGDCFRTFIDEARSIGNEVMARREFCAEAVEFITQKGLFDEWSAWHAKRHEPPTAPNV